MRLLAPSVGLAKMLQLVLAPTATLKLFSNNITPASGDTAASYTEVAGGGYASKSLTSANWGITNGVALYNSAQSFDFTGVTNAPGTVYGYYIVDASNVLLWAERFAAEVVPFTPVANSLIRVTPRIVFASA